MMVKYGTVSQKISDYHGHSYNTITDSDTTNIIIYMFENMDRLASMQCVHIVSEKHKKKGCDSTDSVLY